VGVERGKRDFVWFYDMAADGLSLDDKRQPIEENDITDILERWQSRDARKVIDRKRKAFSAPREEIAKNGYDLSINRYKESEYEEIVYYSPMVLIEKLRKLESEIQSDLNDLEELLN
jgi:type I restriction enzyme M protein